MREPLISCRFGLKGLHCLAICNGAWNTVYVRVENVSGRSLCRAVASSLLPLSPGTARLIWRNRDMFPGLYWRRCATLTLVVTLLTVRCTAVSPPVGEQTSNQQLHRASAASGCPCLTSWTWKQGDRTMQLSGCSNPDQDAKGAWCPVASSCEAAVGNVTLNGVPYSYDYCQPSASSHEVLRTQLGCTCLDTWQGSDLAFHKVYRGTCAHADGALHAWCHVDIKSCGDAGRAVKGSHQAAWDVCTSDSIHDNNAPHEASNPHLLDTYTLPSHLSSHPIHAKQNPTLPPLQPSLAPLPSTIEAAAAAQPSEVLQSGQNSAHNSHPSSDETVPPSDSIPLEQKVADVDDIAWSIYDQYVDEAGGDERRGTGTEGEERPAGVQNDQHGGSDVVNEDPDVVPFKYRALVFMVLAVGALAVMGLLAMVAVAVAADEGLGPRQLLGQVKSWMAAWTSRGEYSKVLPPMVLLFLLALVSAVLLLAFHAFEPPGVSHTADTGRLCPRALLDQLQDLELRLGSVLSNLTSGDPAFLSMPVCDAGADGYCSNVDSAVALRPQRPGLPEDCTPFCERLTNDLQSTNDVVRALTEATSTWRSDRRCGTFSFVHVFMVMGLAASLFSLGVVALVGSSKAHSSGSGSAVLSFLDGVSQIYKTGTSKFAEVCGQETICPSPELLDELQKLRGEKYELSAAVLELAALQKEVDELRGIEPSLERVKAEHQQLKATAVVVKNLEEENAELAVKASELDAVTSSNAELRNSVAKVLELQSQNQQLQPIASLLESVSANHEQLQQAASRVLDLQSQNQQLQATANLYDNVKAANVNLQQLVAQVVELEAQNQQLRATAALLDLVKAANAELLEAATQVHELQTQNQQLQATASMLDQTRAVNAQLREMVLQVQELQAQNRQLQASASFLHSVKALNADLQDRMVQVQRLQRGSLASITSPKDSLVLRDQEPRSSTPQTPRSSILTSPHSHDSDCGRNRVFIGGLAASVDEQSLAGCFEKYGTVLGTKVVRSAKGQQSRGYGFVTFQLPEHADMAVDAVKDMMALLKPKEPGCYERLTIDYSTSSHMD